MARREKRLQRIRQQPAGVRFSELAAVLADFGFVAHETSGSHVVFRHPELVRHISVPKPSRGPVKRVYVREALALLEEFLGEGDD